nr:cytochrome c oxidase assembly protein [Pseudonocardia sp. HH130630-07]
MARGSGPDPSGDRTGAAHRCGGRRGGDDPSGPAAGPGSGGTRRRQVGVPAGLRAARPARLARARRGVADRPLFAPAAAVGLVLYVRTVRRVHRSGGSWPVHRTMLWIAGCVTVLVATSSGIGAYSTAVFGVHLLGHALLSTVAPLLLVGGHPLTLVRAGASTGMVDRVTALTTDGPLQWLRNPAAAWCLAAVASFGVYASGLFEAVVLEHWSHPVMDAVALSTGLLLFRSVLGAREDDQPAFVRLGMLFAVMMLHAGFAIWLLLRAEPVAGPFYAALAMPFVPDLLTAQRQGAVVAWVVSDVAMVAAAAGVVCSWDREGTSPAAAPEVSS